jgi:ferredoxin
MPKVKFIKEKKEVEVEPGANLRQVALREGIQLYPGIHGNWWANCHGIGGCASCRVHITKGIDNISPQGIREKVRLLTGPITFFARLGHEKDLRLACQARVNGDIEVETQPEVNWHGERFWG